MAKSAEGKTKLSIEWDELFPGDELKIGGQSITIRPLGLFKLASIIKKVKSLGKMLSSEGVTWENYNLPENLVILATVILDNAPDVLSDASNIDLEDIKRLPIEYNVLILDKVLEVNLKSKEALEKNFNSLAEKFKAATSQSLGKSSKS